MTDQTRQAASSFASRVVAWQQQHGRHNLPWQGTTDAYRIWLSEIMLQQTQVQTVLPYYERFLERFPTLGALATAPLEEVLERWSGLGYYARARNLQRCAGIVLAQGGLFPADAEQIGRLPGIGRSTAAAISVFAFGQRAAILDGNVKRVLARCFAREGGDSDSGNERELWALAESLLPPSAIESYTQGMMDLGATICTRLRPACAACPLQEICLAHRDGREAELPRKKKRKALPQRQSKTLLLTDGLQVLCERRAPSGIWGGLLSLPEGWYDDAALFAQRHGCRLVRTEELAPLTHGFSHFRLTIEVLRCDVEVLARSASEPCRQWVATKDIAGAALPSPIKKLLLSMPELADPAVGRQSPPPRR